MYHHYQSYLLEYILQNSSLKKKKTIVTSTSSEPSLIDRLPIYFPLKSKLRKAKLLLQYFKNFIDSEGNIISPSNTDKNIITILQDLLHQSKLDAETLHLYIHFIKGLNISLTLINNKFIHGFYKTSRTGHTPKKKKKIK